jgi:hypothetical protein
VLVPLVTSLSSTGMMMVVLLGAKKSRQFGARGSGMGLIMNRVVNEGLGAGTR